MAKITYTCADANGSRINRYSTLLVSRPVKHLLNADLELAAPAIGLLVKSQ